MSFPVTIIAVLIAIGGLCIWLVVADEHKWQQFASAHACKISGHIDSSVASGISTSGSAVTTIVPGKIGYTCDDGVTYWRED